MRARHMRKPRFYFDEHEFWTALMILGTMLGFGLAIMGLIVIGQLL